MSDCIDCRHCAELCDNDTQILCDIKNEYTDVVSEESCNDFEEARYVITESGIFSLALCNTNIADSIFSEDINEAWDMFTVLMERHGFFRRASDDTKKTNKLKNIINNIINKFKVKTQVKPIDLFKRVIKIKFGITDNDTIETAWDLFVDGMERAGYIK